MKQEQHFSYPLDLAAFVRGRLTELHARAPALAALEEILEVAFFASMKTEESEPVLCTLAYVDMKNPDPMPPERIVADRWSYVRFEQPIPLDVKNLVKVSKSIDSAFAALAVCRDSNERLVIWGAIDQQGQRAAFTSRKADEGPDANRCAVQLLGRNAAQQFIPADAFGQLMPEPACVEGGARR